MERWQVAIEDLDRAIALNPDLVKHYQARARAHATVGEYSKAMSDYKEAIRQDPNNISHYYSLAKLCINTDDFNNAQLCYSKIFELNPSDSDAIFTRGRLLLKLNKFDLAIADFKTAIKQDKSNSLYHEYYASSLLLAGNTRKAHNTFQNMADNGMYCEAYENSRHNFRWNPFDFDAKVSVDLKTDKRFFVSPDIPSNAVSYTRQTLMPPNSELDIIECVYLNRRAKSGFLVTPNSLYWNNGDRPRKIFFSDIYTAVMDKSGRSIRLNNSDLQVTFTSRGGKKYCNYLYVMLEFVLASRKKTLKPYLTSLINGETIQNP